MAFIVSVEKYSGIFRNSRSLSFKIRRKKKLLATLRRNVGIRFKKFPFPRSLLICVFVIAMICEVPGYGDVLEMSVCGNSEHLCIDTENLMCNSKQAPMRSVSGIIGGVFEIAFTET